MKVKETKTCSVCAETKFSRFYGGKANPAVCGACYMSKWNSTKVVKSSKRPKPKGKHYEWEGW